MGSAISFAKRHPVGTAVAGAAVLTLLGPRRVMRIAGKGLVLAGTAAKVKNTLA